MLRECLSLVQNEHSRVLLLQQQRDAVRVGASELSGKDARQSEHDDPKRKPISEELRSLRKSTLASLRRLQNESIYIETSMPDRRQALPHLLRSYSRFIEASIVFKQRSDQNDASARDDLVTSQMLHDESASVKALLIEDSGLLAETLLALLTTLRSTFRDMGVFTSNQMDKGSTNPTILADRAAEYRILDSLPRIFLQLITIFEATKNSAAGGGGRHSHSIKLQQQQEIKQIQQQNQQDSALSNRSDHMAVVRIQSVSTPSTAASLSAGQRSATSVPAGPFISNPHKHKQEPQLQLQLLLSADLEIVAQSSFESLQLLIDSYAAIGGERKQAAPSSCEPHAGQGPESALKASLGGNVKQLPLSAPLLAQSVQVTTLFAGPKCNCKRVSIAALSALRSLIKHAGSCFELGAVSTGPTSPEQGQEIRQRKGSAQGEREDEREGESVGVGVKEWRMFFPGVFSSMHAICVDTKSNKRSTRQIYLALMCVIDLIHCCMQDSLTDVQQLLFDTQPLSPPLEKVQREEGVVRKESVRAINNDPLLSLLKSRRKTVQGSVSFAVVSDSKDGVMKVPGAPMGAHTLSVERKVSADDIITGVSPSKESAACMRQQQQHRHHEQLSKWRVDVLQHLEKHFLVAFRSAFEVLTESQRCVALEGLGRVLMHCHRFLGERCVTCLSLILISDVFVFNSAGAGADPADASPLLSHNSTSATAAVVAEKDTPDTPLAHRGRRNDAFSHFLSSDRTGQLGHVDSSSRETETKAEREGETGHLLTASMGVPEEKSAAGYGRAMWSACMKVLQDSDPKTFLAVTQSVSSVLLASLRASSQVLLYGRILPTLRIPSATASGFGLGNEPLALGEVRGELGRQLRQALGCLWALSQQRRDQEHIYKGAIEGGNRDDSGLQRTQRVLTHGRLLFMLNTVSGNELLNLLTQLCAPDPLPSLTMRYSSEDISATTDASVADNNSVRNGEVNVNITGLVEMGAGSLRRSGALATALLETREFYVRHILSASPPHRQRSSVTSEAGSGAEHRQQQQHKQEQQQQKQQQQQRERQQHEQQHEQQDETEIQTGQCGEAKDALSVQLMSTKTSAYRVPWCITQGGGLSDSADKHNLQAVRTLISGLIGEYGDLDSVIESIECSLRGVQRLFHPIYTAVETEGGEKDRDREADRDRSRNDRAPFSADAAVHVLSEAVARVRVLQYSILGRHIFLCRSHYKQLKKKQMWRKKDCRSTYFSHTSSSSLNMQASDGQQGTLNTQDTVIQNAEKKKQLECALCKKPAGFRCSSCRSTYYCSKDHLKQHWPIAHKKECQRMRTLSTASSKSDQSISAQRSSHADPMSQTQPEARNQTDEKTDDIQSSQEQTSCSAEENTARIVDNSDIHSELGKEWDSLLDPQRLLTHSDTAVLTFPAFNSQIEPKIQTFSLIGQRFSGEEGRESTGKYADQRMQTSAELCVSFLDHYLALQDTMASMTKRTMIATAAGARLRETQARTRGRSSIGRSAQEDESQEEEYGRSLDENEHENENEIERESESVVSALVSKRVQRSLGYLAAQVLECLATCAALVPAEAFQHRVLMKCLYLLLRLRTLGTAGSGSHGGLTDLPTATEKSSPVSMMRGSSAGESSGATEAGFVRQAAVCALDRIAIYQRHQDCTHLLRTNLDYLVDSVCLRLVRLQQLQENPISWSPSHNLSSTSAYSRREWGPRETSLDAHSVHLVVAVVFQALEGEELAHEMNGLALTREGEGEGEEQKIDPRNESAAASSIIGRGRRYDSKRSNDAHPLPPLLQLVRDLLQQTLDSVDSLAGRGRYSAAQVLTLLRLLQIFVTRSVAMPTGVLPTSSFSSFSSSSFALTSSPFSLSKSPTSLAGSHLHHQQHQHQQGEEEDGHRHLRELSLPNRQGYVKGGDSDIGVNGVTNSGCEVVEGKEWERGDKLGSRAETAADEMELARAAMGVDIEDVLSSLCAFSSAVDELFAPLSYAHNPSSSLPQGSAITAVARSGMTENERGEGEEEYREEDKEGENDGETEGGERGEKEVVREGEQLVLNVLQRCAFFLSVPILSAQVLVVDILGTALYRLSGNRRLFLPQIYQIWSPLMARLRRLRDELIITVRESDARSALQPQSQTERKGEGIRGSKKSGSFRAGFQRSVGTAKESMLPLLPALLELLSLLLRLVPDFLSMKLKEDLLPEMFLILQFLSNRDIYLGKRASHSIVDHSSRTRSAALLGTARRLELLELASTEEGMQGSSDGGVGGVGSGSNSSLPSRIREKLLIAAPNDLSTGNYRGKEDDRYGLVREERALLPLPTATSATPIAAYRRAGLVERIQSYIQRLLIEVIEVRAGGGGGGGMSDLSVGTGKRENGWLSPLCRMLASSGDQFVHTISSLALCSLLSVSNLPSQQPSVRNRTSTSSPPLALPIADAIQLLLSAGSRIDRSAVCSWISTALDFVREGEEEEEKEYLTHSIISQSSRKIDFKLAQESSTVTTATKADSQRRWAALCCLPSAGARSHGFDDTIRLTLLSDTRETGHSYPGHSATIPASHQHRPVAMSTALQLVYAEALRERCKALGRAAAAAAAGVASGARLAAGGGPTLLLQRERGDARVIVQLLRDALQQLQHVYHTSTEDRDMPFSRKRERRNRDGEANSEDGFGEQRSMDLLEERRARKEEQDKDEDLLWAEQLRSWASASFSL